MADVLGINLLKRKSQFALGNSGAPPTLVLKLFVNDIGTITCLNVPGDFTECTAPGYEAYSFSPTDWTDVTVGCVAEYQHDIVVFNFSGPGTPGQTIYGHYVIDSTAGQLWWAQAYDTPIVLPAGAYALNVTLDWKDQQCPS
jgi:hypothetical protein